jgi:hypothetical protein
MTNEPHAQGIELIASGLTYQRQAQDKTGKYFDGPLEKDNLLWGAIGKFEQGYSLLNSSVESDPQLNIGPVRQLLRANFELGLPEEKDNNFYVSTFPLPKNIEKLLRQEKINLTGNDYTAAFSTVKDYFSAIELMNSRFKAAEGYNVESNKQAYGLFNKISRHLEETVNSPYDPEKELLTTLEQKELIAEAKIYKGLLNLEYLAHSYDEAVQIIGKPAQEIVTESQEKIKAGLKELRSYNIRKYELLSIIYSDTLAGKVGDVKLILSDLKFASYLYIKKLTIK